MSDGIKRAKNTVSNEIKEFETYFAGRVKTVVPLLDTIIKYIIRHKGKQIRPLLVFLSAKIISEPNHKTFEAATLIELLHTASLVHDDIVDEAYERRSKLSVNALWKSKNAVLIGDYLLSKGMLTALENNNYDLLQSISKTVSEMSEGELMQAKASRAAIPNEEIYFEIIRRKTASLFAACTMCGAQSVTENENKIRLMKEFGEAAGMAFQIKDDLLDYQENNKTGKKAGNDLSNMKFTLPLIYAMKSQNIKTKNALKKHIIKEYKELSVATVKKYIIESGVMEDVYNTMIDYRNKAVEALTSFSDSEAKKSLEELLDFIIDREK